MMQHILIAKRTVSDEILNNRAYEIAINLKHDTYQRGLPSMVLLYLKKLGRFLKLLNLKLMIESGLISTRTFLAKVTPKIGQEKYL